MLKGSPCGTLFSAMSVWDLSSDYFDEGLDLIRGLLMEMEAEVELCAGGEARHRITFGASILSLE